MKTILSITTIAALAASGSLFAQTAYSTASGYISLGNTSPGTDNVPANTDVFISVPLLQSAAYAGTVSSISGNSIQISGTPSFTTNAWVTTPHVVVIESGAKSGLIAPIISHTQSALTVSPGLFDLANVVANDKVSIRPAWTIGTLMAGASSLTGVQLLTFSNTQLNINNSASNIYYRVGAQWENADGDNADNVIVYPGEGFIVRTSSTPIADFTISGAVPTCKSYVAIGERNGGSRDTTLSYISPVNENLGTSGLGITSGDILLDFNNNIAGLNKSGALYFYVGNGNWENADGDPANDFQLTAGKAYIYRRAASTTNSSIAVQDTQTYNVTP